MPSDQTPLPSSPSTPSRRPKDQDNDDDDDVFVEVNDTVEASGIDKEEAVKEKEKAEVLPGEAPVGKADVGVEEVGVVGGGAQEEQKEEKEAQIGKDNEKPDGKVEEAKEAIAEPEEAQTKPVPHDAKEKDAAPTTTVTEAVEHPGSPAEPAAFPDDLPPTAVEATPSSPDPERTPQPTQFPTFPAPRQNSTPLSVPLVPPSPSPSTTSLLPPSPSSPNNPPYEPLKAYAVVIVGFDHAVGPNVEWSYPKEVSEGEAVSEQINRSLPFLALPDGAHLQQEDYSYFHLFLPHLSADSTVFGISCNRQLASTDLLHRGSDITRSTVQKAIVVLANKPVFGCIRDKLGLIVRAYFAQRDFEDRSLLVDFYHSLETSFELGLGEGGGEVTPLAGRSEEELGEGNMVDEEEMKRRRKKGKDKAKSEAVVMYMGTSLRELIQRFRLKTLTLVKLLLLQRKLMFCGHPVESLCNYQYSLVSTLPCLLVNLQDAGSPILNERSRNMAKPTSLKTSDKDSLLRYLGLPLDIFGEDSFFQPYLALQQIDMLKASSYLVGTTNSIFQQQRDTLIDVVANIETGTLEIKDPKLTAAVALTAADRKWMDELIASVDSTWNPDDPSRPVGNTFVGSDDYLRAEFENYVCAILSSIKYAAFKAKAPNTVLAGSDEKATLSAFGDGFITSFKMTRAFRLWDKHTDSVIFDLVDPRHPCDGKVNLVEDVGIRLSHTLKDYKVDEALNNGRETISKGFATGSENLWRFASSVRQDLSKRQADWKQEREKKEKMEKAPDGGYPPSTPAIPPSPTVEPAPSRLSTVASFFRSKAGPVTPTAPAPPSLPKSSSSFDDTENTFFTYTSAPSAPVAVPAVAPPPLTRELLPRR